jgi:hypothetical protein
LSQDRIPPHLAHVQGDALALRCMDEGPPL